MPSVNLPRGISIYHKPNSKFWYAAFTNAAGKRVRKSTGEVDEAAARIVALDMYEGSKALSFMEAAVQFFEIKQRPGPNQLSKATLHGYRNSLRATAPYVKDVALKDIDQSLLKRFVRERRAKVSDASVKRDLAFLSTVFSFAMIEFENAPEANPLMMYNRRHLKEKARDYFLTYQEYKKIDAACTSEWQRVLVWVAVCTGMRHGELLHLSNSWINWERKEIAIPKGVAKGGRPRVIPMVKPLCVPLQEWCAKQPTDRLFTYFCEEEKRRVPFKSFQSSWRGIRLRAGMKHLRLHDLRHTFASWWVQDGGDLKVLAEILGHTSTQVTDRYAHLCTTATQRAAAERNWHTFDTIIEEA